jgi:hypothetical protein
MRKLQRPLFRETAVQRYFQRQEQVVLLRTISPAVFVLLWIAVGFLLIVLLWLMVELNGFIKIEEISIFRAVL